MKKALGIATTHALKFVAALFILLHITDWADASGRGMGRPGRSVHSSYVHRGSIHNNPVHRGPVHNKSQSGSRSRGTHTGNNSGNNGGNNGRHNKTDTGRVGTRTGNPGKGTGQKFYDNMPAAEPSNPPPVATGSPPPPNKPRVGVLPPTVIDVPPVVLPPVVLPPVAIDNGPPRLDESMDSPAPPPPVANNPPPPDCSDAAIAALREQRLAKLFDQKTLLEQERDKAQADIARLMPMWLDEQRIDKVALGKPTSSAGELDYLPLISQSQSIYKDDLDRAIRARSTALIAIQLNSNAMEVANIAKPPGCP